MPSLHDTPAFPGPVHAHWRTMAADKGFDLIARIRDRYHLQRRCRTCGGSFTAKLFTLTRHQPLCPHCLAARRSAVAATAGVTFLGPDPDRRGYCRFRAPWPRRPTRTNKGKIPLFIVGVDAVKDAVYARLKLTEPGPGAIHFPRRLDADYFRQLTAERVVTRFERGRPIRSWQPKRDGERNEALDTFVYAHAALHGLISMGLRLNEEVEGVTTASVRPGAEAGRVIRSAWIRR